MIHDPYCYPNTSVLRNKFHIRDEAELKVTEARVAALALFAFENEPLHLPIDEGHLKATHRAIFKDVYDWAGSYRENTGTMTKGRTAGPSVTYGSSQFIPAEMTRIFRELDAENYLQGLDPATLARRLAYFYSEIDATHPFREGNSRTLRKFIADLALAAGYELDWVPSARNSETINALYRARDRAAQLRQYDELAAIILKNLSRLSDIQ